MKDTKDNTGTKRHVIELASSQCGKSQMVHTILEMKESMLEVEVLTTDIFEGHKEALAYLEARGYKHIGPGVYSIPQVRSPTYKEYTVMGYLIVKQGWTFQ